MPRPGRAFVQARELDARGAEPCAGCGHELAAHRELPAERAVLVEREGQIVGVAFEAAPAYRPLDFHCGVDGCSCVMRPEGS